MRITEKIAPRLLAPALLVLLVLAGLLAACGAETPTSGPGPTPTPHPAAADEMEIVRYAVITDVTAIQTSHRVVTMVYTSTDQASASGPSNFEADTKAPDSVYAKGNLNGIDFERLWVGDSFYRKDASGKWEQYVESNNAYLALYYARDVPYQSLLESLNAADYGLKSPVLIDAGGEEMLDGRSTKHFTWELTIEPEGGQKQRITNDIWIDPAAKRAYKLQQCGYVGTAGSSPAGNNCWSVTISKVNEPVPSIP